MNLLENEESMVNAAIIRAVKEMGFEQMTPIQEQAIPLMLEGKDLIGQAQTGTGKTAAFGIPLIQMCDEACNDVQAIVLCPTRELAIQAAEEIRKFAKYTQGVKVLPIYGGQDISKQIRSLRGKVSIVVGTPGRVMDHMRRHTLKLDALKMVVLDEADEMLNMGFREDIETILQGIPAEHQTALFSATMPQAILDITKTYQKSDAQIIRVTHKELTIPLVKQYYYEVNSNNKADVAARLLDYYNPKRSLIFCNTKHMVDQLCEDLKGRGYFAEGLHGDLSQNQRDKVMNGFRKGTVEILIATDVAARGIDVDDVEAVINYDVPQDIEYYVHRIGRTGRAGRKGRAFTFVVGREIYKIRDIERVCKTTMQARQIPSAKDVTSAKANQIFAEIIKTATEEDLTALTHVIEEKMEDHDLTAIEIAAAFLKAQMGEKPEEIKIEKFVPRNRGRYGRDGGRGRDGRNGRGGHDGYRGGRDGGRDNRGYKGSRDGGGRYDHKKNDGTGDDRRRDDDRAKDGYKRDDNRSRDGFKRDDRRRNDNRSKDGFKKDDRNKDGRKKDYFSKDVSSNEAGDYGKRKKRREDKDQMKRVLDDYQNLINKKKKRNDKGTKN